MLSVVWIDPECVPVGMGAAAGSAKALAAIFRNNRAKVHLENTISIFGINHHFGEIKWPPHHILTAVAFFETFAAIF